MSTLVGIVLVLGTMILVHEIGHFIAAKFFGVRVEVFSVGFPPRLWGIRKGDTDYRISAIPLGGYVKMAGDNVSKGRTGAPDEFLSKPRWQRAIIAFAGPAVNLIMPLLLLTVFFFVKGIPHPAYEERPVEVLTLAKDSQVSAVGLQIGDRVVELNGIQNPTWEQALTLVEKAPAGTQLRLVVEKDGNRRSASFSVPSEARGGDWPFGYVPDQAVLDQVDAGTPAAHAGLRAGDLVVGLNGQTIVSGLQFREGIKQSNGQPIVLKVRREKEELSVTVQPRQGPNERGETVWQIGVRIGPAEDFLYRREGFGHSVEAASYFSINGVRQVIGILGNLFTGRVSVRQLSSIIGISQQAGIAVKKGPSNVVFLMAVISINLGVLNLLPIPILDGGHILLLAIEGFRRRDLSLAFKERFVQVGFVFLMVFLAIVMYFDISRIAGR